MVSHSVIGPPRAQLFEPNRAVPVGVDVGKRGADLRGRVASSQPVEQQRELSFVDRAIAIAVNAFEAVTQRIQAHGLRLRRFAALTKRVLLLGAWAVGGCSSRHETPKNSLPEPAMATAVEGDEAPPLPAAASGPAPPSLPPLRTAWLERLNQGEQEIVIMPPLGAIAPSRLILGVHGAGDRPDWSCGGWRLGAQVSAIVVCPQGTRMTSQTFAWQSAQQLGERSSAALSAAVERFGPYVDSAPFIFAGFSQGATLAEAFLRQHAAQFPIAILAEGGYATARSPNFARAFYAAGGRRVVLVCGTSACFSSAVGSKKLLERASLQVLVVGDPLAGHNLNGRMQHALQSAWADISAPLAGAQR